VSAYTTVHTQLVSPEHVAAALRDLGFAGVEVHETPRPLVGWQGERRAQRAEVIVRREHVGESSNDIGFARGPEGTLVAVISEFDRDHCGYDAQWLERLTQRYAYHVARERLEAQGFDRVEESRDATDTIRMVLRRSA
jgi:hypothetical protein